MVKALQGWSSGSRYITRSVRVILAGPLTARKGICGQQRNVTQLSLTKANARCDRRLTDTCLDQRRATRRDLFSKARGACLLTAMPTREVNVSPGPKYAQVRFCHCAGPAMVRRSEENFAPRIGVRSFWRSVASKAARQSRSKSPASRPCLCFLSGHECQSSPQRPLWRVSAGCAATGTS